MNSDFRNRLRFARATEEEMLGRSAVGGEDSPDEERIGPRGTGTRAAGYLPPAAGPFRCAHCVHFHGAGGDAANVAGGEHKTSAPSADEPGLCDEAHARTDPMVRGRVQAGGCCSFYAPLDSGEEVSDDEPDEQGTDAASF